MNKRKTNYFVTIINLLAFITYIILMATSQDLADTTREVSGELINIYNNNLVASFLYNLVPISIVFYFVLALANIICGIQNREYKKLSFWQLAFGLIMLYEIIGFFFEEIPSIISIIAFTVIPIIIAIKNLIFIKRNKPSKLRIISYVLVIVIMIAFVIISRVISSKYTVWEILDNPTIQLLQILINRWLFWTVVSIITQFIYVYNQEKNIDETKRRKILNIIIYYVIQAIVILGFAFLVIYSVITTKIGENKWNNQLSELYEGITQLQGSTNQDEYVIAVKDGKFGFINSAGQEKISCEFDKVTGFYVTEIDNTNYYFALAQQDGKYYVISKEDSRIEINDTTMIDSYTFIYEEFKQWFNERLEEGENEYSNKYTSEVEAFFAQIFFFFKGEANYPREEGNSSTKEIELQEDGSIYYYGNNFSIKMEPTEEIDGRLYQL